MEWTGERWVPGKSPASVERQHLARYYWAKKFCKEKRVLDFGCGCGQGTALLGRHARIVEGWDIDPEAIAFAERSYGTLPEKNYGFAVDDVRQWDGEFDVAICFEMIEHVDDTEAHNILERLWGSVVDNGLVLLSTPNRALHGRPRVPNDTPWHKLEYNERELRELVTPLFRHVAYLGQIDVPQEPEIPPPMASLIGVEHLDSAEFLLYVGRKF